LLATGNGEPLPLVSSLNSVLLTLRNCKAAHDYRTNTRATPTHNQKVSSRPH